MAQDNLKNQKGEFKDLLGVTKKVMSEKGKTDESIKINDEKFMKYKNFYENIKKIRNDLTHIRTSDEGKKISKDELVSLNSELSQIIDSINNSQ